MFEKDLKFEDKIHDWLSTNFYPKFGVIIKSPHKYELHDYQLKLKSGKIKTVEEKARRIDYGDFIVETVQNTRTNSEGWFYTCHADIILYIICDNDKPIKIYTINWPKLKAYLEPRLDYYDDRYTNNDQLTKFKIIPWEHIQQFFALIL